MIIIIGGHWKDRPKHFTGTNIQYNGRIYCFDLTDDQVLSKVYLDEKLGVNAHLEIFPILEKTHPKVILI